MIKQYGIDPRLIIWIRKNTGHDLQTFSDLAQIKCLDSRRRNYSAKEKIEDIRLPSWLVLKENDFSLIGEMTKLKQLSFHDVAIDDYSFLARCRNLNTLNLQDTSFSDCRLLTGLPALKKVFLPAYSQLKHTEVLEQLPCLKEIKEEKPEEPEASEKPSVEMKPSAESPVSRRPESGCWGDDQIICLYFNKLEEMPELTWPGVPYLFMEGQETEPHEISTQEQNKRDYMEMIRQLYAVEELQGYTEEEIAIVKKYFDPLPLTLGEFWKKAVRTEAIHKVQDRWIRPEDFEKWAWLREGDYLVILIENQGCCRAGIRRKDLTKADPPVYVAAIDDQKWTLCARTFSEFLRAALAYEAVFAFSFHGEELMYWLTEEELETIRSGLEKQPFGLHGWLGMDMSFYSNASDNMVVVMDCGDLEVLWGAASEEGYEKLMEVMKDLGEAM